MTIAFAQAESTDLAARKGMTMMIHKEPEGNIKIAC
jgi:hypothetical protein